MENGDNCKSHHQSENRLPTQREKQGDRQDHYHCISSPAAEQKHADHNCDDERYARTVASDPSSTQPYCFRPIGTISPIDEVLLPVSNARFDPSNVVTEWPQDEERSL